MDVTDPALEGVMDRIKKLLNLASKNTSEAEAAAAAAKAQELLIEYNLDAATVERATGAKDGKREDIRIEGGFYQYQRDLWEQVAALNFCYYFTQEYQVKEKVWDQWGSQIKWVTKRRHRIVGRIVNTKATIAMAQYLEAAIERVLLERLHNSKHQARSKWATGFRKGASLRLQWMLFDRRQDLLKKERFKKIYERAQALKEGRAGQGTGSALTLMNYSSAEDDANIDFIHGEGTAARWAQQRAERAAEKFRKQQAYTAWAAAHPEEAAKREREEQIKQERKAARYKDKLLDGVDRHGFYSGYDAATTISLDQQVGSGISGVIGSK